MATESPMNFHNRAVMHHSLLSDFIRMWSLFVPFLVEEVHLRNSVPSRS